MRIVSLGLAAAISVGAGTVRAESLFAGRADLTSKLRVLDGRAATQYAGSTRLKPQIGPTPERRETAVVASRAATSPVYTGRYRGEYLSHAKRAARRHGIPEDLFLRLVQRESGWNPAALSHKGAIGLAQLMPGTARGLGVDPADPLQNLDGGARYLSQQYRRFRDWRLALAAYNAGPEAVEKHGGVPPYAETLTYVKVIWGE